VTCDGLLDHLGVNVLIDRTAAVVPSVGDGDPAGWLEPFDGVFASQGRRILRAPSSVECWLFLLPEENAVTCHKDIAIVMKVAPERMHIELAISLLPLDTLAFGLGTTSSA
jgi:hypothetical protein